MKKNFIRILVAALFVVAMSACGKMANPVPYEGSGYPHSYPRG